MTVKSRSCATPLEQCSAFDSLSTGMLLLPLPSDCGQCRLQRSNDASPKSGIATESFAAYFLQRMFSKVSSEKFSVKQVEWNCIAENAHTKNSPYSICVLYRTKPSISSAIRPVSLHATKKTSIGPGKHARHCIFVKRTTCALVFRITRFVINRNNRFTLSCH